MADDAARVFRLLWTYIPRSDSASANGTTTSTTPTQSTADSAIPSTTPTQSATPSATISSSSSNSSSSHTISTSSTSAPKPLASPPPSISVSTSGNDSAAEVPKSSTSTTQSVAPSNTVTSTSLQSSPTLSTSSSSSSQTFPLSGTSTDGSSALTTSISTPSGTLYASTSVPDVSAPSHSHNLPIILGPIFGALALVLILSLLFFLRQRKRRMTQVDTLQWETVKEYPDDTPPQSPLSSDSGHTLLPSHSLDSQVYAHWINSSAQPTTRPISESLVPAPSDSRGSSPGAQSTISTVSTITFAQPVASNRREPSRLIVTPTGHYSPTDPVNDIVPDESWLTHSRKTRPSLMTLVHDGYGRA